MNIRWNLAIAAFVVTASAAAAYAQQAVILVRHAELEGAAMAEPKVLPLSESGEARAKRLAIVPSPLPRRVRVSGRPSRGCRVSLIFGTESLLVRRSRDCLLRSSSADGCVERIALYRQ